MREREIYRHDVTFNSFWNCAILFYYSILYKSKGVYNEQVTLKLMDGRTYNRI